MTFARAALLTFCGACLGGLGTSFFVSVMRAFYWWYWDTPSDPAFHDQYFVVVNPLFCGALFGALSVVVLVIGKAGSLWWTTIAFVIVPAAVLFAPMLLSAVPPEYSLPASEVAILLTGLVVTGLFGLSFFASLLVSLIVGPK